MHQYRTHHGSLWVGPVMAGLLAFPAMGFGLETKKPLEGEQVSENTEPRFQQDSYRRHVAVKIQKSEELLTDLLERAERKTGEERENIKRAATKLNAELDHAKRMFQHLHTLDPEPWQRNKTEMNAVLADLADTYDRVLPFLQDNTRLLQQALDRTEDALFYQEQKDLFLKMTESGLNLARESQKEGIQSQALQEAISQLEDARDHIRDEHMGGAVTLIQSASLHLNSVLKHQMDREIRN